MTLILTTKKEVTTKTEVKEGCCFTFDPKECLHACIRYEGCELEAKLAAEHPKMTVAKKPEPLKCPYGKDIDCQHIKTGGLCGRRTYGNRKPDNPCTSYLMKPKVSL